MQSMSSIKRDVKKKPRPRPEAERIFSISSPLFVRVPPIRSGVLLWMVALLVVFSAGGDNAIEPERLSKRE
jgi:hypothetical protein